MVGALQLGRIDVANEREERKSSCYYLNRFLDTLRYVQDLGEEIRTIR